MASSASETAMDVSRDDTSCSVASSSSSSSSGTVNTHQLQTLIDALPYHDDEYDARKGEVQALIEAEMKAFPPERNYLAHLPSVPELAFADHPVLATEMQRLRESDGTARMQSVVRPLSLNPRDVAADAPPPHDASEVLWSQALRRRALALEHSALAEMNAQLLHKYATPKWKKHLAILEAEKTRVQGLADELRDAVQEVNKQRKDAQLKAGAKLSEDTRAWFELVRKNQQIEAACLVLEEEIAIARAAQAEAEEESRDAEMADA